MFDGFFGNTRLVNSLGGLLASGRLPQTLLFAGPPGIGKATLARLLAAASNCSRGAAGICRSCSHCRRILQADLSLPEYRRLFDERAQMTAEKRRENPLIVSTHPEFLCFPPDGPLPQISIEQVRRLQDLARFGPSEGRSRLFLVDRADQIDGPAANSLLKILEEPPPYLTLILTAENPCHLLPTIRSRCVPFWFAPLGVAEMERFLASRPELAAADRKKLFAWGQGSPGRALAVDMAVYQNRREAMLALLRTAAGQAPFGELLAHTESIGRNKQEKLEMQLDTLYGLLHDLALLRHSAGHGSIINQDIQEQLRSLAASLDFEWLENARVQLDTLDSLARRNIQKQIALEAVALALRPAVEPNRPRARQ